MPFSLSKATLGFEFALADGEHFGLAKTNGLLIEALYIQSTPGADLALSVSPPTGGVPEPASWALLITGFIAAGASLRRTRRTSVGSSDAAGSGPRSALDADLGASFRSSTFTGASDSTPSAAKTFSTHPWGRALTAAPELAAQSDTFAGGRTPRE